VGAFNGWRGGIFPCGRDVRPDFWCVLEGDLSFMTPELILPKARFLRDLIFPFSLCQLVIWSGLGTGPLATDQRFTAVGRDVDVNFAFLSRCARRVLGNAMGLFASR